MIVINCHPKYSDEEFQKEFSKFGELNYFSFQFLPYNNFKSFILNFSTENLQTILNNINESEIFGIEVYAFKYQDFESIYLKKENLIFINNLNLNINKKILFQSLPNKEDILYIQRCYNDQFEPLNSFFIQYINTSKISFNEIKKIYKNVKFIEYFGQNDTLYVYNLKRKFYYDDIYNLFSEYGEFLLFEMDKFGYAFTIKFKNKIDLSNIIFKYNNKIYKNYFLYVIKNQNEKLIPIISTNFKEKIIIFEKNYNYQNLINFICFDENNKPNIIELNNNLIEFNFKN